MKLGFNSVTQVKQVGLTVKSQTETYFRYARIADRSRLTGETVRRHWKIPLTRFSLLFWSWYFTSFKFLGRILLSSKFIAKSKNSKSKNNGPSSSLDDVIVGTNRNIEIQPTQVSASSLANHARSTCDMNVDWYIWRTTLLVAFSRL